MHVFCFCYRSSRPIPCKMVMFGACLNTRDIDDASRALAATRLQASLGAENYFSEARPRAIVLEKPRVTGVVVSIVNL